MWRSIGAWELLLAHTNWLFVVTTQSTGQTVITVTEMMTHTHRHKGARVEGRTHHSDAFKGKNGRAKEERELGQRCRQGDVRHISEILQTKTQRQWEGRRGEGAVAQEARVVIWQPEGC